MIKKTAKVIHKLRVYFLVIIVIFFFSYLGLNPVNVGKFLGGKIGSAVGMNVGVAENPFNKLALQLQEKEDKLDQREKDLDDLENALNEGDNQDILIYLLGGGIFVLFILVVLNYYMDFRRKKKN